MAVLMLLLTRKTATPDARRQSRLPWPKHLRKAGCQIGCNSGT
jgi:hypothetical protein